MQSIVVLSLFTTWTFGFPDGMAGISNNANKAKSCAILSAEASRKKRGAGNMRTQRLKDSNSEDVDSLSSVHCRVAMTFSDYQFASL